MEMVVNVFGLDERFIAVICLYYENKQGQCLHMCFVVLHEKRLLQPHFSPI